VCVAVAWIAYMSAGEVDGFLAFFVSTSTTHPGAVNFRDAASIYKVASTTTLLKAATARDFELY
jgi:hypothetical protein